MGESINLLQKLEIRLFAVFLSNFLAFVFTQFEFHNNELEIRFFAVFLDNFLAFVFTQFEFYNNEQEINKKKLSLIAQKMASSSQCRDPFFHMC